jgi:hypothetical protein
MERVSDRHTGDLDGRLTPLSFARAVTVAVVVAPESAALTATQHTAWMTVNLLARCEGVIAAVRIACPDGVALTDQVVPGASPGARLVDALLIGGRGVGAVPVAAAEAGEQADITLVIGSGASPAAASSRSSGRERVRYVCGDGWWGGVDDAPMTIAGASPLPFGPYIGACLAVGETFLTARLPHHVTKPSGRYGWDAWSQQATTAPDTTAPDVESDLDLTGTVLAGVGAVGTAWVHTIWAVPGLRGTVELVDDDREGVATTNLNRCPLFGADSLGQPKAKEAARICADGTIAWKPRRGRFQDSPGHPTLLISAVDTNRAREALQQQYVPRILSASTSDVRAEVLRIGPPGIGACLRCYNPPEALIADDDLRQRALAAGSAALDALAAEVGVERTDVERELNRSRCSEVGDRLLTVLRRDHPLAEPRFAVGFTSALAGTLLAAETVKVLMNAPMMPRDPQCNNVTFQFLKPQSTVNEARRLHAEPGCPACSSTNAATAVWQDRVDRLAHGVV